MLKGRETNKLLRRNAEKKVMPEASNHQRTVDTPENFSRVQRRASVGSPAEADFFPLRPSPGKSSSAYRENVLYCGEGFPVSIDQNHSWRPVMDDINGDIALAVILIGLHSELQDIVWDMTASIYVQCSLTPHRRTTCTLCAFL